MKTKANKKDIGKQCTNCGHIIYYSKHFGLRCWCDTPEVNKSILDKKK